MRSKTPPHCEQCRTTLVGRGTLVSIAESDETLIVTVRKMKIVAWMPCCACQNTVRRELGSNAVADDRRPRAASPEVSDVLETNPSAMAGQKDSSIHSLLADQTSVSQTMTEGTAGAPDAKPPEYCTGCRRQLTGAVEVSAGVVDGIETVTMQETPDRNWIQCDYCNRTVCKNCCTIPDSGYCDACYFEFKIKPHLP